MGSGIVSQLNLYLFNSPPKKSHASPEMSSARTKSKTQALGVKWTSVLYMHMVLEKAGVSVTLLLRGPSDLRLCPPYTHTHYGYIWTRSPVWASDAHRTLPSSRKAQFSTACPPQSIHVSTRTPALGVAHHRADKSQALREG